MLQVLKNVIIVLVAVVILDHVFTYVFMNYIFKYTISGESGGTINYVINKKKNVDFLILGASRAKHGIDPQDLTALGTDGYNLGINGTSVLNSLLVLDILVQHGVRPKTVMVQADLGDLVSDTSANTTDQISRVYPYNTALIQEYVDRMGYLERIKYFFGLYRLNRKVINISFNYVKRNSIPDNNGYVGLPSIKDYAFDAPNLSSTYVYSSTTTSAEAIKRMQDICNKNNIKFLVLFPPSYKNARFNKTAQENADDDLRKSHVEHILNLSDINSMPDLVGSENWRDEVHLNATGSEKFSKELNDYLKRLTN